MGTGKIVIELDHRGVLGVDADLDDMAFIYLIAPAIANLHKAVERVHGLRPGIHDGPMKTENNLQSSEAPQTGKN